MSNVDIFTVIRCETSFTEIAYILGYNEPNSFFKAFQDWTDYTQGKYQE